MRSNINNKDWLEAKLSVLVYDSSNISEFHKFQCKPFFVGALAASYNEKKYNTMSFKNNKQIKFVEKMITNLNK